VWRRRRKRRELRSELQKRVKGLEPDQNHADCSEIIHSPKAGAAKASVAVCPPVPADPDLVAVSRAWPTLPETIRTAIVALVKAVER